MIVGKDCRDVNSVTSEMVSAGEESILAEVGGADLGALFSARDLAIKVYLAMSLLRPPKPDKLEMHNQRE